ITTVATGQVPPTGLSPARTPTSIAATGPQVCAPPRTFLPQRLIAAGQPMLLRPSRTCFVASACIGYANHPPRQLVVWGLAPHELTALSAAPALRRYCNSNSLDDPQLLALCSGSSLHQVEGPMPTRRCPSVMPVSRRYRGILDRLTITTFRAKYGMSALPEPN